VGQAAMGLSPQPAAAVTAAATVTLHITHTQTRQVHNNPNPNFQIKSSYLIPFFFFFTLKSIFKAIYILI
jgi:hypothetical protein